MNLGRGQRVGAYVLEQPLGRGGWGEVWAATDELTGEAITLKRLHPDHASTARPRLRFFREAMIANRIDHPGITRVYGVFETDAGVFIAFERLHGAGLDTLLHASARLPIGVFVELIRQVAEALGAAHRANVVHRDLKPANIFVHRAPGAPTLAAKILDFGVSKLLFGDDGLRTQTSSFLGTPRYVSPEHVLSASNVDGRSDVWALGVILFEGLTGAYPHTGATVVDLLRSIARDPPEAIEARRPTLPASLRAAVRKCLKPLPSRYSSALAVAEALSEVLSSGALDPGETLPERVTASTASGAHVADDLTDAMPEPLLPETLESVTELWEKRMLG